jgi:putative ABC transport system permease protein
MPAFDGLAGTTSRSYAVLLQDGADPEVAGVGLVTRGYFNVLGIQSVAGRFFTSIETDTPGTALAIISERLWRSRLNADPAIAGRTIRIAGRPFTLIGVAKGYRGLSRIGSEDLWIPATEGPRLDGYANAGYKLIGRLAPGVTPEAATSQTTAAFARIGPVEMRGLIGIPRVVPGLVESSTDASFAATLGLSAAGAALLLVLACANAAGLLLSRNLARRRDLSVRASLGASRVRLFRGLLVEMGLVSLAAAVGGLVVADAVRSLFSGVKLRGYIPLGDVALDWRVAGCTIAVATATVFVAGGLPSFVASRADPQAGLRDAGRGATPSGRTRHGLVAIQLAVTLALLVCAGVLAQTMAHLHAIDLGFVPEHLLTISERIRPQAAGRDSKASKRFQADLQRRLSETPGIEAAAYSAGTPLEAQNGARVAASADAPLSEPVITGEVSADYFRALGIPLRDGRSFTDAEAGGWALSGRVIVDELLARQLFGTTSVVGRRIWISPYWLMPGVRPSEEIIGVVGSTVSRDLRAGHQPTLYFPVGDATTVNHEVRTSLPTDVAMATIRRVAREVDPLVPVEAITTTAAEIDLREVDDVILSRLAYAFALMALGLALAGAYAITACTVHERTREFGIRVALGASRPAIFTHVLGRVAVTTLLGLGGGIALCAGAERGLASRLFGIPALDPVTIAAASTLLLAATLAAAWLPARTATRVDPSLALRS